MTSVTLEVNGLTKTVDVEPRKLLTDVLRQEFSQSGVHIGCAHGACGCCTVHMDGHPRLSCLTFAIQADGSSIRTVESLGGAKAEHPLQQALRSEHGLQCGYCTPGFLMTLTPYVDDMIAQKRLPDSEAIREAMSGNICRCTGYHGIVAAVRKAILAGIEGAPAT